MSNPFESFANTNPFSTSDWSSTPFINPSPFGSVTDVVRGISNMDEIKEESETFSVSEVRYKPPSPITGLVTSNNILVFALENGHVIRLNLLEPAGLEGITIVLHCIHHLRRRNCKRANYCQDVFGSFWHSFVAHREQ